MLRKHSETAAFVLLLIATAIPYGLLINTGPMPFWLTIVAAMVSGVFSAVVAAPMGRVVRQRLEDRARVRRGGAS
jgi:membrane protein implicated in regulation of membrane protease activity